MAAEFNPKDYKDRLGVAAELEAQGVKIDGLFSGNPTFSERQDYFYDAIDKVFRVCSAAH
jgi:hypothetical protein